MATVTRERVVIVVGNKCQYTLKGENHGVIKYKAMIYKTILKKTKAKRKKQLAKIKAKDFETCLEESTRVRKMVDNGGSDAQEALNEVKAMLTHKDRSRYHAKLVKSNLNMLFCTDAQLSEVLKPHMQKHAKKINYIKNGTTHVRKVFRCIGREMAYADGEVLKRNVGDFEQKRLIHTGNPMTSALQYQMQAELTEKAKETGEDIKPKHHSSAVSLPLAVWLITKLIAKLGSILKKGTSLATRPTKNKALLLMIYGILIHEGGSRIAETVTRLVHSDLFFVLHKRVPMLVLVFLAPKTLHWLMENNILSHYVIGMFKGKFKQETFVRRKAVIPYPFNLVDLPTIYTLVFKFIMWCNWDSTTQAFGHKRLFPKTKDTASKLRMVGSRWTKSLKLEKVTFYSFRYAAAEEDKKIGIKDDWTRKRMGHSETSTTKDKYARENTRAIIDGFEFPLSVDLQDETSETSIPYELKPMSADTLIFQNNWLEKTFKNCPDDSMRKDFEETAEMVIEFVENGTGFEKLKEKFFASHERKADLMLPLGTNISFPSAMLSDAIKTDFEKVLEDAKAGFGKPETGSGPHRDITVEIKSFPQIVYGNWRTLIGEKPRKARRIPCAPAPPPIPVPAPKPDPDPMQEDEDGAQVEMEAMLEEQQPPQAKEPPEEEENEFGWCIKNVDPGNFVVVLAKNPDKAAFRIGETYVWILKFKKWVSKLPAEDKYVLQGTFLENSDRDIAGRFQMRKRQEKLLIGYESVVHIYDDTTLTQLETSDIEELKEKLA